MAENMKLDDEMMTQVSGGQSDSEDGYIGEGKVTSKSEPGYYVLQDNFTQWYALYEGSDELEEGTRVRIERKNGRPYITPIN